MNSRPVPWVSGSDAVWARFCFGLGGGFPTLVGGRNPTLPCQQTPFPGLELERPTTYGGPSLLKTRGANILVEEASGC